MNRQRRVICLALINIGRKEENFCKILTYAPLVWNVTLTHRIQCIRACVFLLQDKEAPGITGKIRFDRYYKTREDFHMDIVEYKQTEENFIKVAQWNATGKLYITRSFEELKMQKAYNIRNKRFKVVTRTGMPFLQLKQNATNLYGNDRYEGFIKDLMDAIAKLKNFKYDFYLVPDGQKVQHDPITGKLS